MTHARIKKTALVLVATLALVAVSSSVATAAHPSFSFSIGSPHHYGHSYGSYHYVTPPIRTHRVFHAISPHWTPGHGLHGYGHYNYIPHVRHSSWYHHCSCSRPGPHRAIYLNGMPLSIAEMGGVATVFLPPPKKSQISWESGRKSLAGD